MAAIFCGSLNAPWSMPTSLLISDNTSFRLLWREETGIFLFSSDAFSSSLRYVCSDLSVATAIKPLRLRDNGVVALLACSARCRLTFHQLQKPVEHPNGPCFRLLGIVLRG